MDAQTLFKIAAFLNAISIPGHFVVGHLNVYPALATLNREYDQGKAGSRNSWDNIHVLLLFNGKNFTTYNPI
jgi:hypothetical protein